MSQRKTILIALAALIFAATGLLVPFVAPHDATPSKNHGVSLAIMVAIFTPIWVSIIARRRKNGKCERNGR
ncbi:hypothetical protein [Stakelama marina]|uniref:Uncharacterized protein n=1 Tax=Stakelama marina TaxID=2826939 RepID=A0A8T4IEN1_9SPHN|nr:hypothetical protein [Stakelama marina]MBR0551465.1 hypothetical protein [Stakelama marina]